ncbi:MAG: hypothetical protein ACI8W7_000976 [Gammaproteobacteria bacterium]
MVRQVAASAINEGSATGSWNTDPMLQVSEVADGIAMSMAYGWGLLALTLGIIFVEIIRRYGFHFGALLISLTAFAFFVEIFFYRGTLSPQGIDNYSPLRIISRGNARKSWDEVASASIQTGRGRSAKFFYVRVQINDGKEIELAQLGSDAERAQVLEYILRHIE